MACIKYAAKQLQIGGILKNFPTQDTSIQQTLLLKLAWGKINK